MLTPGGGKSGPTRAGLLMIRPPTDARAEARVSKRTAVSALAVRSAAIAVEAETAISAAAMEMRMPIRTKYRIAAEYGKDVFNLCPNIGQTSPRCVPHAPLLGAAPHQQSGLRFRSDSRAVVAELVDAQR